MRFSSDFHKINCMLKAGACLSDEKNLNVSFKKKSFYVTFSVMLPNMATYSKILEFIQLLKIACDYLSHLLKVFINLLIS